MERIVKAIERPIYFEDAQITDIQEFINRVKEGELVRLVLPAVQEKIEPAEVQEMDEWEVRPQAEPKSMVVGGEYIIAVRQYMTKPASKDFDFQMRWNNDIPMPMRVMAGKVIQETRGMFKMECHGIALETGVCMRCGRTLTHPVSRLYGIGPECGSHFHINPFDSSEELYAELDKVKAQLESVRWTGWVIKSAIESWKER